MAWTFRKWLWGAVASPLVQLPSTLPFQSAVHSATTKVCTEKGKASRFELGVIVAAEVSLPSRLQVYRSQCRVRLLDERLCLFCFHDTICELFSSALTLRKPSIGAFCQQVLQAGHRQGGITSLSLTGDTYSSAFLDLSISEVLRGVGCRLRRQHK